MKRTLIAWSCGAAVMGASATASSAEVMVVTERSDAAASPAFRFGDVATPSATDAGNVATFTLIDGTRDGNAGRLSVLHDGRIPATSDEPDANFFFGGSLGGKLLVDLDEPRDVRRIDTYSWHTDTRAPQVYRLYASGDGTPKFDAPFPAHADPTDHGWELLASVDTRPAGGDLGGQYGVSVSRERGRALGRFRYLLFDIAPTADATPFTATFFSEIDIHDGHTYPPPERGDADVVRVGGKYEIVFDTTETPDLKAWVDATLKPACAEWYPKIVRLLPSDGYEAPRRFSITFYADMDGVAHAAGNRVSCSAKWFRANLEGEAVGAVVHEMVHVVQQYRGPSPGWLVEGVADYVRWFLYEPESERPRPNADRVNHDDSYRTTGHFLDYVSKTYDPQFVPKLNALLRDGRFHDGVWQQATGKPIDDLAAEWKRSLRGE